MIKHDTVKQNVKVIREITCNKCGRDIYHDDFESQESVRIKFIGGYGSVFGDGYAVSMDICQHCLKDAFGDVAEMVDVQT